MGRAAPESEVMGAEGDRMGVLLEQAWTRMFDGWAFQTWGHILAGATVIAGLFLCLMVMTELVIGGTPRLSRAAVTIAGAAFLGYVGTALIIRRKALSEEHRSTSDRHQWNESGES